MKVKIVKVVNNNVLVILDKKGDETIAMGNGIGFRRKPGEFIPYARIEKTFILAQKENNNKLQQLVSVLPTEHFLLSEKIIQMVHSTTGWKLSDNIYITLTDHISSAICRYEQKIIMENALHWDVKHLYPEEYLLGKRALDIIEIECRIRFPSDEASYIALHFVNARMNTDGNMERVQKVTKIIREITSIIKYHFHFEQNLESEEDYQLINRIRILGTQILQSRHYENMHEELYEVIRQHYGEIYPCAEKIRKHLLEQYSYMASGEEILSLVMGISQFYERYKERKSKKEND